MGNRSEIIKYAMLSIILLSISFYPAYAIEALYLDNVALATYACIERMTEPSTGLPYDRLDAIMLDLFPQCACMPLPDISKTDVVWLDRNGVLSAEYSNTSEKRRSGLYGLQLSYDVASTGSSCSFNFNLVGMNALDIRDAAFLELWAKGTQQNQQMQIALWSVPGQGFPVAASETITIPGGNDWERIRLNLEAMREHMHPDSLFKISFGFYNSMNVEKGTVWLDDIAFVDQAGNPVHPAIRLHTTITNIGLSISCIIGAVALDLIDSRSAEDQLEKIVGSLERSPAYHGFLPRWIRVNSPESTFFIGNEISTIDAGNLAAGLVVLRNKFPSLAARASVLLDRMDWTWLYDGNERFFYLSRNMDGVAASWHYGEIGSESRLSYYIGIGSGKISGTSWESLLAQKSWENKEAESETFTILEPGHDGGGLFLAFLPRIFIDEDMGDFASFEILSSSAQDFVAWQKALSYKVKKVPAWGWSATALPPYGYEYGGYGFLNYDAVNYYLTPHASMLAAEIAGTDTLTANLLEFEKLGARQEVAEGSTVSDFGFRTSVNIKSDGVDVCSVYLVLDQCLGFLGITNHITGNAIRKLFMNDAYALKTTHELRLDVMDTTLPNNFPSIHNYPNPFNPSTTFEYYLPRADNVVLAIYDVTGRVVKTLAAGEKNAGTYRISWDGTDARGNVSGGGVYFCTLRTCDGARTQKILLLR